MGDKIATDLVVQIKNACCSGYVKVGKWRSPDRGQSWCTWPPWHTKFARAAKSLYTALSKFGAIFKFSVPKPVCHDVSARSSTTPAYFPTIFFYFVDEIVVIISLFTRTWRPKIEFSPGMAEWPYLTLCHVSVSGDSLLILLSHIGRHAICLW